VTAAPRLRHLATALGACALLAVCAAPARADQAPAFASGPTIAGQASVGAPLQVVGQWSGTPAPTPLYEWERCNATVLSCSTLDGVCTATYVPGFEDFGQRLRARVTLVNPAGAAVARTPLSDVVLVTPGGPVGGSAAVAPRADTCGAVAAPAAPQTTTPAPAPATRAPGEAPGAVKQRPAYLRPFPIVRIRGYATSAGTHVTLLSVRAPRSARVRATCVGRGCHDIAPVVLAPPGRLRAFERFLPAGTLLQIRVTAASTVGKYTSFRIRARHAPRRVDRCLVPGRWAPAHCPAL
jgi:hypothetical protein